MTRLTFCVLSLALLAPSGAWPQTGPTLQGTASVARLPVAQRAGLLRLHGSNTIGSQLGPDLLLAYGRDAKLTASHEVPGTGPEERTIVMEGVETTQSLSGEVHAHGSATAFTDLSNGKADLGMASRRIDAAEVQALKAAGLGDMLKPGNENVISLDGVAFIVNRGNPLTTLTLAQLRDLMSGRVTRWSQVGGADLPVTIYSRDAKSGTFDLIRERVLGRDAKLAASAKLFESSEDLADAVASDDSAIGFVGVAYARNAKPIGIGGACHLPPSQPSLFAVKTEEYVLTRRLYIYAGDGRSPLADDFRRFVLQPVVYPVMEGAGFVSLEPILAGDDVRTARLANIQPAVLPPEIARAGKGELRAFQSAIEGARRLSMTIRFELAKADLDSRAEEDLARMAQWARTAGSGRKIVLVGHSSADGDYGRNVGLSQRRVAEVAARLRSLGVQVAGAVNVGPVSAVVCDGKPEDSNLNRRVEIWVR